MGSAKNNLLTGFAHMQYLAKNTIMSKRVHLSVSERVCESRPKVVRSHRKLETMMEHYIEHPESRGTTTHVV